jgi:alginate O-acetyltransferase complex protein AlgI
MLFNSISFLFFLPTAFLFYWFFFCKTYKRQNLLLLVVSYFFYACWDWRFLGLLIFSTFLDYLSGLVIHNTSKSSLRKLFFFLSLSINFGFLAVFKYFNFFLDSFIILLHKVGFTLSDHFYLKIVLPVGISFYTFHGVSYVVDVYKNRIRAERDIIKYSLFVTYFPLLVAGPIERATHLLPQLSKKRLFDYNNAVDGLRQMLWGFFKKVVIADYCATYVNWIYADLSTFSGFTLFFIAVLFSIQIYCDFSGYSDIALGVSRLFGIELLRNFNYPYFSRDISEFWRKWHISLSSWFKDYVYIPLGGSQKGVLRSVFNISVIFILSGLWHGANYTFVFWGALNAIFLIILFLFKKNRKNIGDVSFDINKAFFSQAFSILSTFILVTFSWVFFRSKSISQSFDYIRKMIIGMFYWKEYEKFLHFFSEYFDLFYLFLIFLMFYIEWIKRKREHGLKDILSKKTRLIRYLFYLFLIILITTSTQKEQQFIYFQF